MPCDGASFFDNKLFCSSRLPLACITWDISLKDGWKMWRSSIWYLTTDWSHTAATSPALSSSIHKNYLSILTFLLISYICLSVPKKQIELAYLKKKKSAQLVFFLWLLPVLILLKIQSNSVDLNQGINVNQQLDLWSIMLLFITDEWLQPSSFCTVSCYAISFCMAFRSFERYVFLKKPQKRQNKTPQKNQKKTPNAKQPPPKNQTHVYLSIKDLNLTIR